MKTPLISIIVPCYNQAQYLDECLQSILDQTYPHWECIIVNDGSPDNTNAIASNWLSKDRRFKYIKKENGGLSSARNAGLEVAKGDWVQFLDCDDKIDRNKFSDSSIYFDYYDLIISDFYCFENSQIIDSYCDFTNREITYETIILDWDKEFTIPIHCGLFKKVLIPLFDTDLKAKEDWVFWILFLSKTEKNIILKQKHAYYRMHDTSMTKDVNFMFNNEIKAYKKIYSLLDNDMKLLFFINRIKYKNSKLISLRDEITRIEKSKGQRFISTIRRIRDKVVKYFGF